jgi:hypothetical protein
MQTVLQGRSKRNRRPQYWPTETCSNPLQMWEDIPPAYVLRSGQHFTEPMSYGTAEA